jgi:hypothetical protein
LKEIKVLKEYQVKIIDDKGLVRFNRKGKFYDDENALELTHDRLLGFSPIDIAVNTAFLLSGGLTRNRSIPLERKNVSKIILNNLTDDIKTEYDYGKF